MTEHTTIQITKEQADELNARKQYDDEPYKGVIARLLNGGGETADPDEIAEAVIDSIRGETIINAEDARLLGENVDRMLTPVIQEQNHETRQALEEIDTGDVQLDATDIIGRIDDLETTLPRQVADELGAGR